MNNFQTILVAIFLAFFVFAVLIFSGLIKIGKDTNTSITGKVVIWGTLPKDGVGSVVDTISGSNGDLALSYIKKDASTYEDELVEAFANGNGPDLFIITPEMIQRNSNFMYKIPYTSFKERDFRNLFVDGASIYLDNDGVVAYPLVVDPIVLYYNKDILYNEGIVNPPSTWDELFSLNNSLTKKENNGTIRESMIALGQYYNINNAKDILATLLIQNNNSIVERNDSGYISTLGSNPNGLEFSPAETVLKFFVEFSNPSNTAYSWNRSLPNSFDMFTGGKLAFYLGRASELFNIETVNPNLSFDVTQIPQIKNSTSKRTFGDIYAIAVNKSSQNIASAFQIAGSLSTGENAKNLSIALSLPPSLKSLLTDKPDDPYLSTFFDSSLISRSWLDPNGVKSSLVFGELLDNILSNKLSLKEAIDKADGQLNLLNKQQ